MFITEKEFGTLEGLNNALERVYNKAIEDTLKLMPEIIMGLIVKNKSIQTAYGDFKAKHPDLAKREDEIALVVEQIEFEDGSLTLQEILDKVPARMTAIQIEIPEEQPTTKEDIGRTINGFI
jgi:hypothetical protein